MKEYNEKNAIKVIGAYSGDREHPFRTIVNT